MRRALDSSVRDGHSLHRMFLAFRKTLREKGEGEGSSDPSFLSLFDNGNYTVVTGDGELFNRFCRNKSIGNYTGRNVLPKFPSDADYSTARLRVFPFDYAFNYTTNDVDKGKRNFTHENVSCIYFILILFVNVFQITIINYFR